MILTQTMPITLLLFFGYVFGSALAMPGADYRAFLVPGMLAATAANGIMTGMFQAAQDSHRGVMDRFRTLPMTRAGRPARADGGRYRDDGGRSRAAAPRRARDGLADRGRRARSGWAPSACCCCSASPRTWVGILLGLLSRSEEAAGQLGGATFVLPLLSNAYIPTAGFPGWLRVLAEWNPISAVATAVRDLFGNAPVPGGASWPVAHPVAGSLAWCAVLLAVFVPLAVRRYTTGGR